jgi:4-hydroxy-3-methylbut-2-enyl diphosphate reductase
MKVEIARLSGYCFGVKRALELTEAALEKYKNKNVKVYSIGQIIHNRGVIDTLNKKGLIIVENEDQIEPGSVFIVRSHGMSPEFINRIKKKGVKIVDTACPFVKGAQSKAKMLSKRGYHLVIIGNKNHPEVMSEMEHADKENLTVIESPEELAAFPKYEKIGVIMQTTQIKDNAKSIISGLLDKAKEIRIENTICNVTENKQRITKELAQKADVMLIVGGKNSANTTHLAQIASKFNPATYHIENYKEIDRMWLKNISLVGISGGASTPRRDIKEVKEFIEKLG